MAIDLGVSQKIIKQIQISHVALTASVGVFALGAHFLQPQFGTPALPWMAVYAVLGTWLMVAFLIAWKTQRWRHRTLYEINKLSKKADSHLELEFLASKVMVTSFSSLPLKDAPAMIELLIKLGWLTNAKLETIDGNLSIKPIKKTRQEM
jgi:hypothetical protein